jgi:hypothetical protein
METTLLILEKRYCWVIITAALWLTTSFALHAAGAHDQQNLGYAMSHQLLFLLAPLWVNAFVYMTLARLVHLVLPTGSVLRIPAHRIAALFVWADIISFLIQGVGASMAGPGADPKVVKIGINVYMAGIGIQEAFILVFVGLMVTFQRKAKALEQQGVTSVREKRWRMLQYTLYAVLVAITVRIIYRIAEYAGGIKPSNPVPFHEAYSYALDAFPMMTALLLLAIFHPGRVLVGPESQLPSRKERRAEKKGIKALKQEQREQLKAEKKGDLSDRGVDVEKHPLESRTYGDSQDVPFTRII